MRIDHVFFDVETTGLNPKTDDIIEAAAIRTDWEGNQLAAWCQKINPVSPVSEEAAKVNGYNEKDWAEAVDFPTAMRGFKSVIFENRPKFVMVAHEAYFDRLMLEENCLRVNEAVPLEGYHRWICTRNLAWPLVYSGQVQSAKLTAIAEYYSVDFIDHKAHTATGDVQAMMQIYWKMMKRYSIAVEVEKGVKQIGGNVFANVMNFFARG